MTPLNVISTEPMVRQRPEDEAGSEWRNLLKGRSVTLSGVRVNPALTSRFPRGATFNIVGPVHPADVDAQGSNNIENGTSAAPGTFPRVEPVNVRDHQFGGMLG